MNRTTRTPRSWIAARPAGLVESGDRNARMRPLDTNTLRVPHKLLFEAVRKLWRWLLGVAFVAIVLPLTWLFVGTVLVGLVAVGAAMRCAIAMQRHGDFARRLVPGRPRRR